MERNFFQMPISILWKRTWCAFVDGRCISDKASLEPSFYDKQFTFPSLQSHWRQCYLCWQVTLSLCFFYNFQNFLGNEFCSFPKKSSKKCRLFTAQWWDARSRIYVTFNLGGWLSTSIEKVSVCYNQYSEQSQESDSARWVHVVFLGWVWTLSCVLTGSPWAVMRAWKPSLHVDICIVEIQIHKDWIVACISMQKNIIIILFCLIGVISYRI